MKKFIISLFIVLSIVLLFSSCAFDPEIRSAWERNYYINLLGEKTEEKYLKLGDVFIDKNYVSFDAHTNQSSNNYSVTVKVTDIDNITHTYTGFVDHKKRIYVRQRADEILELFMKGPCSISTESDSPYTVSSKYFSFSTTSVLVKNDLNWLYDIRETSNWSHNYYTDCLGKETSNPYIYSNYSFGPYGVLVDASSIAFNVDTSIWGGVYSIQIKDANNVIHTYYGEHNYEKGGYLYVNLEKYSDILKIKKMLLEGCDVHIFPNNEYFHNECNMEANIFNIKIEEKDLKWIGESSEYIFSALNNYK